MPEDGICHLPSLTALTDDLMLRYSHIGEEDLIEVSISRHIHQRPNFNPGGVHAKEQKRNAQVLGCIGFGSNKTENPVSVVSGTGPNLLAVNHPLVTIELGLRRETRQVTACSGF